MLTLDGCARAGAARAGERDEPALRPLEQTSARRSVRRIGAARPPTARRPSCAEHPDTRPTLPSAQPSALSAEVARARQRGDERIGVGLSATAATTTPALRGLAGCGRSDDRDRGVGERRCGPAADERPQRRRAGEQRGVELRQRRQRWRSATVCETGRTSTAMPRAERLAEMIATVERTRKQHARRPGQIAERRHQPFLALLVLRRDDRSPQSLGRRARAPSRVPRPRSSGRERPGPGRFHAAAPTPGAPPMGW